MRLLVAASASVGLALASNALPALNSSTCDAECQKFPLLGAAWEKEQLASTEFEFYEVPSDFSQDMAPGRILKVEETTELLNFTVPSGLSMSRFLYTTIDLDGNVIPASAYVVWPYAPLTATNDCSSDSSTTSKSLPLVAWAHGTSGLLRGCAPSNYRNLQYHFMVPFTLALQGMAVVAPDYAGLGVDRLPSGEPIPHNWLSGPSQSNDLANAILAAREAFPEYLHEDGNFVALGHSQGGGAAWALAERQVDQPIPGYKGTVAIAPATRTLDVLERGLANSSLPVAETILGGQVKFIAAVSALHPGYDETALTPLAYDRWHNVLKPLDGCLPTDDLSFFGLDYEDLVRPGWHLDPEARDWGNRGSSGRRQFKGPLLVLQGAEDRVVDLPATDSVVNDTCDLLEDEAWDESLEFITYAGADHFPIIQASQGKWLRWVQDHLVGESSDRGAGCTRRLVEGFRAESTFPFPLANFLVSWAPLEEGWKYAK